MNRIIFVVAIAISLSCSRSEKKSESITVNPQPSPADTLSAEPYLFSDPNGNVYLSWVEKKGEYHDFKFSKYSEDTWSEPVTIASDSTWFVNWADYPMASINPSGDVLAHVLSKSGDGTFAYDVRMFLSNDKGASWNKSFVIHDDGKQAEHGFVSLLPVNSNFFVTWLDGRNTAVEGMENGDHHGHHGEMSLRAAIVDTDGKKLNEWELDARTCDCCQTSAAITSQGPVVIYRDRSDDEIRDISITRFVNETWTEPASVFEDGWMIAGCPVNGPRMEARGDSLAIAWFSSPEEGVQVKVIFSDDGGETFSSPIRIDEGEPIGRVDVAWVDSARVAVSWMEAETIKAVVVHRDGTKGESFTVATSSKARTSGFPQMIRVGNELIFAWTDDATKRVRVATVKF